MPRRSKIGGIIDFCPVCHSVPLSETLTLLITFEQRVLEHWYFTWIFPVIRPFRGYHYFWPCDLDLGVWPIFKKNFNIAYNFWTVSARGLIFHMSIPCDKTFLWFHLKKILELPYCIWAFLVTRSSYWYQDICPCDLDHLWNWPLSGAFVFHKHILFFLTLAYHIWHIHLSPWEDVSRIFMKPIWHWPLTSRSNL